MNALGIQTGADLRGFSLETLRQHFGKAAAFYHGIARGEDTRPVEPDRPRKSLGKETTFDQDLRYDQDLCEALHTLADRVWAGCEKRGLSGRTITLKLRHADFSQLTRSLSRQTPVRNQADLLHAGLHLLRPLLPLQKPVRLLGITVSSLCSPHAEGEAEQLSLLPSA